MVPTKSQAVLAGIAAGAIGGAVFLVFMTLSSLANEDPWWRYPNLLGSIFYGPPALRAGPGLATISGAGVQIVVCGMVGAVFALVFARWFRTRRLTLLGAVAGLAWMYIAGTIAGRFAPLIPLYTPTSAGTAAYFLFGLCLGMARWFLPAPPVPEPVPPPPPPPVDDTPAPPPPPVPDATAPSAGDQPGAVVSPVEAPAEDRQTESRPREPL